MMPPLSDQEMEERLKAAGSSLLRPPSSLDELLTLLDQTEELLSKVEQSPVKSMQIALSPLMKALIKEQLLKHSDVDVRVGVASCISEITRITAPDAPYDDDKMKDVFQLIVSSFENIADTSSRSHEKRATILETVAKVRSCVIMLDLECDQMITEMFQHFLKAIRDDHAEVIFSSMETIMSLVLEESEDISSDLLNPILSTLKKNNEDVMPIAKKLAQRVVQSCADKLRPYLTQTIKTLGASLDDYNEVVASACCENDGTGGHNNENTCEDQLVVNDGRQTNPHSKDLVGNRSPKSTVTNGVNETGTEETVTDANYTTKADANNLSDGKSMSKIESDMDAQTPVKIEAEVEHAAKRKGRRFNNGDSEESSDLRADEKQAEQQPQSQEISGEDVLTCPSVEPVMSSDKVKASGIQLSPPEAQGDEGVDVASPTRSDSLIQQNRSKRFGRAKRKQKLSGEGTLSGDTASEKFAEGENVSEAKKQQPSAKNQPDETTRKDKSLTGEGECKNDGGSTSDSEKRSLDQTEKLDDAGTKSDAGSPTRKEDGRKSGRVKYRSDKDVPKSSKGEDDRKDTVTSPRSPLKSNKDGSNKEETPRMSTKRKQTPGTGKASDAIEYGENLVGSKVKVWWPKDRMFYEGEIASFDSVKKKHKVSYTDGDEEVLNLRRERWEFVGDDPVSDGGQAVEHSSHDASPDMPRKKKGTNSEATSKHVKMENLAKSKSKDTATKSGAKLKDDDKPEANTKTSNSKSSRKSEDDDNKSKDRLQKNAGKSHDNSAKDDIAKTPSHSKQDSQRAAKAMGKTPQSGKTSGGMAKSGSSKVKETSKVKDKTADSAKSAEMSKGKSPAATKSRESETKSGKKRKRFYEGEIASFDSVKKKHKVSYTDGDEEVLNLRRERWEFVGDDPVSDGGQAVEHSSHDASPDMPRKKKGTNSEATSKHVKMENLAKSKSKDTATKSGAKLKDDDKPEANTKTSNSKSSRKSEDDDNKSKDRLQKNAGKSHDNSAKDDIAKTPSHSKQDSQRAAKAMGKTPQSGKTSGGMAKSGSSKVKETSKVKDKTADSAKSAEMSKGKSPAATKSRESETKSGKKRKR